MGQQAPARTQGGNSRRENLKFRIPHSIKHVQHGNRRFGTQRRDYVPNSSQCRQHRSDSARSAKTRSVEGVQLCHKIRQKQSLGNRLPPSPCLHQNSTRNFRRKMCRTTTHFVPKLFPPVLPSQTCFIVLACLGFWNTHVIHGSWTYRKSKILRHSLARRGSFADYCFWFETQKTNIVSGWKVGGRDFHGGARRCAGTGGRSSVSSPKHGNPKECPQYVQRFAHHVTTPAHPCCFSRLPWVSP